MQIFDAKRCTLLVIKINGCFRSDSGLSHRHIYEAVSLYWHRKGRQHLSFIPAIQVSTEGTGKEVLEECTFFAEKEVVNVAL